MSASPPVIRVRLTALYAGTIAALMLAATVVLYVALTRRIEFEFDRSLAAAIQVTQGFFRLEAEEYKSVDETVEHIAGEVVYPDKRLEFVRPSGAVLVPAPDAARHAARALVPPVRTLEAPLDASLAPGWRVRVSASALEIVTLHRRLDRDFLLSVPLVTLLAVLVGWWVTGRALRPVGEMALAAERIDPWRPHDRLPIANPGDELGRLGARINALLARLEDAMQQQRRFLADAEHELRTPAARMRNRVELALLDPAGGDDRAALHDVQRDLERVAQVLAELLLLARADAGPQEIRRASRFLDDVVLDALAPWRPVAQRAGIALGSSRVEETPVAVDAVLVERVVGILVDNALRYTPRGGSVDVRVFRDDGTAVLEVEDTGIGIAPDDRAHVFDRFWRGTEARRLAAEGSGLGLSIARWVIERHGGRITLGAGARGGTLARVELATAAPVPATEAPAIVNAG